LDEEPLDIIKQIQQNMFVVGDMIIEDNRDLFQIIEKYQKDHKKYQNKHKVKVSTISYFVQEIENRILETIYKYCYNKSLIVNGFCSLCYDGIMLEKQFYHPDLLQEFHDVILEKLG
jgi:hypothetical protein